MKRAPISRLLTRLVVGLIVAAVFGSGMATADDDVTTEAGRAASERDVAPLHPVVIEHPTTLGRVTTELRDAAGRAIGVECATCHTAGDEPALADLEAELAKLKASPSDFHGAIELKHGNLPCDSCHDPEDRTRLRLASGETLEMGEVITLCGQCHSSQLRSYQHMAHGGARGYWDRTKGPTQRNSCVSCHAAHAPAYPLVYPAPGPNDRFLVPHAAQTEASSNHE